MTSTLPIQEFKGQIMEAVGQNQVVIITAETGAGKSTQMPQYLLEAGYNIVVTQPRRLAARTVAQRVAQELGVELGTTVGYRTAEDRLDGPETRCLFATDGLAMVRELMGAGEHNMLVIDECHEWNMNIEVLVAWVRRHLQQDSSFKVVLMSATIEAQELSEFFGNAPVITVPGRLFPVEVQVPGPTVVDDAARLLKSGRNVLVFQPGKAEIEQTIRELGQMGIGAECLPLHGDLSAEEQAKCFQSYYRPKCVVSTNVAQTSVTIDDIDAVVDSGKERRKELVDGVEGLYLKAISLADSTQRKGRAGRTKPGIYIDHCGELERQEFPKAEILRSRLDQTVLRLAQVGFDMEELDFFHQPDKAEIHEAKRVLKALGCMDASGAVTRIGYRVAKMPISVKYARMIIEAERLDVFDDVITIAAILEVGEITDRKNDMWRHLVRDESQSDVMAQLAIYKAAEEMSDPEMDYYGIHRKAFYRARQVRKQLLNSLVGKVQTTGSTGDRESILKSVCVGMVDHLYEGGYGSYQNGDNIRRQLNKSSVVRSGERHWAIGKPFDLQIQGRYGPMMLNLVNMVTKVDPMWLAEVAPHLANVEKGVNPRYDSDKDVVVSSERVTFNGRVISETVNDDPNHPQASKALAEWLADRLIYGYAISSGKFRNLDQMLDGFKVINKKAGELNARVGTELFPHFKVRGEWAQWFLEKLNGVAVMPDTNTILNLCPTLDSDLIKMVMEEAPDIIEVSGKRLAVTYEGGMEKISLERSDLSGDFWKKLPDEGVVLPGGRRVFVEVRVGAWNCIGDDDITMLKARLTDYFQRETSAQAQRTYW